MLERLEGMSIYQQMAYCDLVIVFKIQQRGQPEYLAAKLSTVNRLNNIIVPNSQLEITRKSFEHLEQTTGVDPKQQSID